MSEIVLYFGKVNLVSSDINDVLNNTSSFRRILENVIIALRDGTTFVYERPIKIDDVYTTEEIEYSLAIKEKDISGIQGYIYKKSFLHYKDFNEKKKELDSKKIANTEGIQFFYDPFRELFAYHRSLRFGYKEVLTAFEGIINNACKQKSLNYIFSLSQYTEGINLDDFKQELKNEGPIQKIDIKYQIPNPESDLLEEIRLNKEQTINEFESANLAFKNVEYSSNSETGINIEAEIISRELKNIESMHSHISAEKAFQNGYVVVETTNIKGLTRSSAEMRPMIKHISGNENFGKEAKNTIISIIAREINENQ